VPQIAPSGYRHHAACQSDLSQRSTRAQRDEQLTPHIEHVGHANLQVYGEDKVWWQLHREGMLAARCTVERLMCLRGLRGAMCGKGVRTTTPDTKAPCLLDRVQRVFMTDRPISCGGSDFTYVSTWQGFV
jgi:putative transposase